MLIFHWRECCAGYFLLCLILWACASHAYRVNTKRAADDPEKRDFHPATIFLAPFTWPLFLIGWTGLFTLRAFLYGIFLFVFTFALLINADPTKVEWLDKTARRVGGILLKANTFLVRQLFQTPAQQTE